MQQKRLLEDPWRNDLYDLYLVLLFFFKIFNLVLRF